MVISLFTWWHVLAFYWCLSVSSLSCHTSPNAMTRFTTLLYIQFTKFLYTRSLSASNHITLEIQ